MQCLSVGIDSDKLDAFDASFYHAVYGCSTCAAYSNHLNPGKCFYWR
jgi:hypothetical protein